MTPEWEELKSWLISCGLAYGSAVKKMEDIERRTLPERVAKLLDGFDFNRFDDAEPPLKQCNTQYIAIWVTHALRTGDTSPLEKWQVKK